MSDGSTAIFRRWLSQSSQGTCSTGNASWFKAGATGLVIGLLATYLFGYGDLFWADFSWTHIIFLLLYTLSLVLVVSHLSSSYPERCDHSCLTFSPLCPRSLTKVRSYLAFFPITHVIHHGHQSGTWREPGKSFPESVSSIDLDLDNKGLSLRINAQLDMAIDAIVAEYVCPWYTKISDDRSFLDQCKAIIHAVFLQLAEKLKMVDRNELAKEAIQIVHIHWKQYTEALGKTQQPTGEEITKNFNFVHPFLQDGKEVSKRYQSLVSRVFEELAIPDLSSPVMCQLLAGIVVKNFVLFYAELLCQPSWINGAIMSLLSSGSMSVDITGSSSQNSSSPASPLPEPSPKVLNIFPDEIIENPATFPPSTGDSTPTKKSRSSSGGRSLSGQEEPGKGDEGKNFLETISSSLDDPSSASEPRTESSSGTTGTTDSPKPEKKLPSLNLASDSGIHVFKRPRELQPLKSSQTTLRTLTTALGTVMTATAYPLLPSECYTDEQNLPFSKLLQQPIGKNLLKGCHVLEGISESDSQTNTESDSVLADGSLSEPLQPEEPEILIASMVPMVEHNEVKVDSPSEPPKPSHYYSFDEASKPKSVATSYFESSTLSLDGGLDQSKRQVSQDQLSLCSHEFKSDGDGKPTRSPVYEEPEDFAASIAKLRSLLEQKGRKSCTPPLSATLEDGDVFESPPSSSPSAATSSADKPIAGDPIPLISETCASESHTTPSSTSSMDNSKSSSRFSFNEPIIIPSETDSTIIDERTNYDPVPEIKCCFRNVTIPKVENSADAGGQYMFYCIQYEGVYFDDDIEGVDSQKLVYRTTTIKRKFKEFLTLQAHLEENIACKPHLKGIKTPTRWTNVSLTKSDAIVANQRRAMLEKYLQQLCYHPVIGFCQEVLVFMAYGEDGFCSFEVGDPKDLLTHRLDKLARKFTGVINSLKDALPSFELDLSPAPNTPKSEGITPSDLKPQSSFPSFPFPDKYSSLPQDKEIILDPPPWPVKNAEWNSGVSDSPKDLDSKLNDGGDSVDASESEIVEEGKIFSAYPLAAAVTQLLCDVLWLPQYRPHQASVATFMSISGKSLENYVLETMDIFLSDEAVLGYLEWLTISINNGQSDTDSRCDISSEYFSEQDLKNIVKRRIPAWVRWMWGRNRLDLTIDRIAGLFQYPLVNHDLALSLCELLFSKMVNLEEASCE